MKNLQLKRREAVEMLANANLRYRMAARDKDVEEAGNAVEAYNAMVNMLRVFFDYNDVDKMTDEAAVIARRRMMDAKYNGYRPTFSNV